jgi:hypothetical protein
MVSIFILGNRVSKMIRVKLNQPINHSKVVGSFNYKSKNNSRRRIGNMPAVFYWLKNVSKVCQIYRAIKRNLEAEGASFPKKPPRISAFLPKLLRKAKNHVSRSRAGLPDFYWYN